MKTLSKNNMNMKKMIKWLRKWLKEENNTRKIKLELETADTQSEYLLQTTGTETKKCSTKDIGTQNESIHEIQT